MMNYMRFLVFVLASTLLAGCTLTCPFIRKSPAPATSATASPNRGNAALAEWQSFYSSYCAAVRARDRHALARMMRKDFVLSGENHPTPEKLFEMLDAKQGAGWEHMERALTRGTVAQRLPNMTEEGRVAKFRPANSNTSVWVIFQRAGGNRWAWSGLMTPRI